MGDVCDVIRIAGDLAMEHGECAIDCRGSYDLYMQLFPQRDAAYGVPWAIEQQGYFPEVKVWVVYDISVPRVARTFEGMPVLDGRQL